MTKPLGYYCGVTPGDGSFLDHIQNKYGSQLEGLSRLEKLYILNVIIINLIYANPSSESEENIQKIQSDIRQHLPITDHLSLAEAIINQLKYQQQ